LSFRDSAHVNFSFLFSFLFSPAFPRFRSYVKLIVAVDLKSYTPRWCVCPHPARRAVPLLLLLSVRASSCLSAMVHAAQIRFRLSILIPSFNLDVHLEHIELPAKLLDYFLRSSKSNINQSIGQYVDVVSVMACVCVCVCVCASACSCSLARVCC